MPAVPSPDFGAIAKEAGINTANGLKLVWQAVNGIPSVSQQPTGLVSGPGTSVVGDVALWNNTLGTVLKDGGAFTAQNLTDYAHGTWTPSDGSGASLVITVAVAPYIKIGKMVFASMAITYPANASAAGAVITGLPFTPVLLGTPPFGMVLSYTNTGLDFTGIVIDGTPSVAFEGVGGAAITNTQFSGLIVRGMVIYQSA